MTGQTCKTCKFYMPGKRKTMDLSKPVPGLCYRFPPSSTALLTPSANGVAIVTVTSYPEVSDHTSACGEFVTRLT